MGLLDWLRRWSASHVRPPFERTVCACKDCTRHCKSRPGALIPSDLDRIGSHLVERGLIPREGDVVRYLRAAGTATVRDTTAGTTIQIGKLTPARDARGRCVFLDEANLCRIHTVSPYGCAYFDAHMDTADIEQRQVWGFTLMRASTKYQRLYADLARTPPRRPHVAGT